MNSFETKNNTIKFLIPQVDLFPPINKYGCNFRSLQAIAEITCRRTLQKREIVDLHSVAENMEWIDKECDVDKPEEITNSVFKWFESKQRVWNCGIMKDGEPINWKGHNTDYDFSIIKLWQPNMKDKHFVLGDDKNNLIFDPYPNSKSVQHWMIKDIYLYSLYEV